MISISINEEHKYENFREDFREEIKEFQKYLAISDFPDLQKLFLKDHNGLFSSCLRELAMLIEKTNGTILDVDICINNDNENAENTGMFIDAISKNCPKIKTLYIYLHPKDFAHIKLLLLNCRCLEYIWFGSLESGNDNIGDELLDILTKFSSKSLTDIRIAKYNYSIDAFEQFFESCRERTKV